MKKYWNRLAAAGMAAMMTGSLLTGCGTQATPENLLRDMTERMEETDSALCTMVMSMEATDGTDTIGLTMDLDMETTSDPDAAHGKGRIDMDVSGTNIGTEMEIYSVEENDQYVTYTMVENQWTRAENEESGMPGNEMFGDIEDQVDLFELSEDLVDVNGQECFELQGNIGGDAVGSMLEEDMLDSLAGIAVDESELASAEIPCTIDIYRETILPARIYIDMADIMTSVMSGTAAGASFSECYIEMTFTEFDSVDEITVPEEALAASGGTSGQDTEGGVPEYNTEQPSATAEQSGELGSSWESHTVQINDTVITLPCSYEDLQAAGVTLNTEYTPENYIVNAEEYELAWFTDGMGNEVMAEMVNGGSEAVEITECFVGGISVSSYDLENGGMTVIFPGGIQIGSTKDQVLAAYGQTEDVYEGDYSHMYTWYGESYYYESCEIDFDAATGLVSDMYMTCYDL